MKPKLPTISSRNLISESRSFNQSNNLLQQNSTKDTLQYRSLGRKDQGNKANSNRNLNLGASPSLAKRSSVSSREVKILTVSKSVDRKKKKGTKKGKPMVPPLNLQFENKKSSREKFGVVENGSTGKMDSQQLREYLDKRSSREQNNFQVQFDAFQEELKQRQSSRNTIEEPTMFQDAMKIGAAIIQMVSLYKKKNSMGL